MTIKHYAGYGRVSAKRIKDDAALHVRVSGNHEQGLNGAGFFCGMVQSGQVKI